MRWQRLVLGLVLTFGGNCSPLFAQAPPARPATFDERLRQLEAILQVPTPEMGKVPATGKGEEDGKEGEKEQPRDDKESGAGQGDDIPLRAFFNDGFSFESSDGEYLLNIHLMNQTDFKVFAPGNQEPARSGLYNPRFRVYFEGHLQKPFEYELSIQRSVEGAFDVLDANLNFHPCDQFQIKFGRFLVPYSYDWYDHLEQYFITPERSLFPLNFGLAREVGLMAWGSLFDKRVQYALGGFDGQLIGLADNNTTRDAVGYVNFLPFRQSTEYPGLRFLNIGGSIALGQQAFDVTPLPLRTSVQSSDNDEAAQAASAIFLDYNPGVVAHGGRAQGAIHAAWYVKHLSLEAEWQIGRFGLRRPDAPAAITIPVSGYHISLSYFITGEEVEGRKAVKPLRPLYGGEGSWGPGAIEPFIRYSQLDISDRVFTDGFADPEKWTKNAYVIDTGWNWYWNQYIKFYFDWQLSVYGSPVLLNEGEHKFSRVDNLFWARCQIYY
jgi:phosphate-selective porin OprO/OprP